MATILNKDLVRESTQEIGDKAMLVTIKADQSIDLKLKGVRGDGLNISLIDLWEYLGGEVTPEKGGVVAIKKVAPKKGDNKMISLYDLRNMNMISMLDLKTKVKLDGIIKEVIDNTK